MAFLKTKEEIVSPDLFNHKHSKLIIPSDDLSKDVCIFLTGATYLDHITKKYMSRGQRFIAEHTASSHPNQVLKLYAVQYHETTGSQKIIKAAPVTYYRTLGGNQEQKEYGRWAIVEANDQFFYFLHVHNYFYHIDKINKSTGMQELRKLQISLSKKTDAEATNKASAIDTFLKSFDDYDFMNWFRMLTGAGQNTSTYNTMTAPRPHIIRINLIFTVLEIDLTATSPAETKTFRYLSELDNHPNVKKLKSLVLADDQDRNFNFTQIAKETTGYSP